MLLESRRHLFSKKLLLMCHRKSKIETAYLSIFIHINFSFFHVIIAFRAETKFL